MHQKWFYKQKKKYKHYAELVLELTGKRLIRLIDEEEWAWWIGNYLVLRIFQKFHRCLGGFGSKSAKFF